VTRRMLIVDDDPDFRRWARAWLDAEGYEIVGEAGDGASALEEVRRLRPEVVLLDIQLPDVDGFEVAELLLDEPDPPEVVLISSRELRDYGDRIAASGARGFASKEDLSGTTLESLLGAPP
jgi:DNA-binding NarL/FixJ family response regulator